MNDDSIFREVDEAIRQDQVKALWDKYGVFVLIGAVALVAGVAGYNAWHYWQARQAADAGARFAGALQLEDQGKAGEAKTALDALAEKGPRGYRLLARFQLAAATAKSGDREGAVKAYDALASDLSGEPLLQGCAVVEAATLRLDQAGYQEMSDRLGALAESDSPWRYSARDLLGFSAYRNGKHKEAEDQFGRILSDTAAPLNMRRRAEMMMALLVKADANAAKQ